MEKRKEHLALVGTIRPIEDPWWDTHTSPLAWNCKCTLRRTRRAVTPVPAEGPEEEAMPSALRQNPGKTTSPLKLYEQLRRDPDYTDVDFDPKTGGLKATHVRHNFDKKGGTGEKRAQGIGFQAGNAVLLLEEDSTLLGIKTVDGLWNGEKMEIATSLRGSANSIVRGLSHCTSKPGVSVAVIVTMKTPEENVVSRALARFKGLKKSNPQQWKSFTKIVIIDVEKAQMISVVPQ